MSQTLDLIFQVTREIGKIQNQRSGYFCHLLDQVVNSISDQNSNSTRILKPIIQQAEEPVVIQMLSLLLSALQKPNDEHWRAVKQASDSHMKTWLGKPLAPFARSLQKIASHCLDPISFEFGTHFTPTKENKIFNFKKFPTIEETKDDDTTDIQCGDLHGNVMKLIHFLLRRRLLTFKGNRHKQEESYNQLYAVYENLNSQDRETATQSLNIFINILENETVFAQGKTLRLIGDILADRGGMPGCGNDYLTLLVLKRLKKAKVPVSILFSNHDAEFLLDYYRYKPRYKTHLEKDKEDKNDKKEEVKDTLEHLGELVKKKIVTRGEVSELVDTFYMPDIKAIDYLYDKKNHIPILTLFTHAPNGLETIKALAKKYKVEYPNDSKGANSIDPDELCKVIDAINQAFAKDLISGYLDIDLSIEYEILRKRENFKIGKDEIPIEFPLMRLIWNRLTASTYNTLVVPTTLTSREGKTILRFANGHIGYQIRNTFPHVATLDSSSGKCQHPEYYISKFQELFLALKGQLRAPQPPIHLTENIKERTLLLFLRRLRKFDTMPCLQKDEKFLVATAQLVNFMTGEKSQPILDCFMGIDSRLKLGEELKLGESTDTPKLLLEFQALYNDRLEKNKDFREQVKALYPENDEALQIASLQQTLEALRAASNANDQKEDDPLKKARKEVGKFLCNPLSARVQQLCIIDHKKEPKPLSQEAQRNKRLAREALSDTILIALDVIQNAKNHILLENIVKQKSQYHFDRKVKGGLLILAGLAVLSLGVIFAPYTGFTSLWLAAKTSGVLFSTALLYVGFIGTAIGADFWHNRIEQSATVKGLDQLAKLGKKSK